jgi:hypothetical protein
MTTTADSTIPTRYLTSLNRHLRKHGLGETVLGISMPRHGRPGDVHIYQYGGSDLSLFAQWLGTLRGVTVTVLSETRDRCAHLKALGGMGDGTLMAVLVVVDENEFDLLCANTPVVKDADIPVDLLLSLVSADAAEGVPALAGQVSA